MNVISERVKTNVRKILISALIIVLSVACDVVVEDPYFNPVLGSWNSYYQDTDSLILTRVFDANFYSYFSFSQGRVQNQLNKQHYTINKTHIVLDRYAQGYVIQEDTLWITNSKGDLVTKYLRGYSTVGLSNLEN